MPKSRRRYSALLVLGLGLLSPAPLTAQASAEEKEPASEAAEESGSLRPKLDFGLEAKANFRNSEENRFPVPFPFPPSFLPVGQTQGFEETVNAGSHFELSDVTLYVDAVWGD